MSTHKYEIVNESGDVVGHQELDHNFAPYLLAGHSARLVAIDGQDLEPGAVGIVQSPSDPLRPDSAKSVSSAVLDSAAEERAHQAITEAKAAGQAPGEGDEAVA